MGKVPSSNKIKLNPKNKQIPTPVSNSKGKDYIKTVWKKQAKDRLKLKKAELKNSSNKISNVDVVKKELNAPVHSLVSKMDKQIKNIMNDPHTKDVLDRMHKTDTTTDSGVADYDRLKQQLAISIFGDKFAGISKQMDKLMSSNPPVTGINVQTRFSAKHQSTMHSTDMEHADIQFTTGYLNTPKDLITNSQQGNILWDKHLKKATDTFLKTNPDISKNLSADIGARYSVFEFSPDWMSSKIDGNGRSAGTSPQSRTVAMLKRKNKLYKNGDGEDRFITNDIEYTMRFNTSKLNKSQREKLNTFLQDQGKSEEERSAMKDDDPQKNAWSVPDLRISEHVSTPNMKGKIAFRHGIKFKGDIAKSITKSGKVIYRNYWEFVKRFTNIEQVF